MPRKSATKSKIRQAMLTKESDADLHLQTFVGAHTACGENCVTRMIASEPGRRKKP
jgi:hypothetical protein